MISNMGRNLQRYYDEAILRGQKEGMMKGIREGKYLNITYKNKIGEINTFWIAILDINANDELYVNMFNVTKDEPILNAKIFISSIFFIKN